jgi:hypothetical protein
MELANETPLPATLVFNSEPGDEMSALAVACVTYRVLGSRLVLGAPQRPLERDAESPVPNDVAFLREGISVCAHGHAYPDEARGKRGRVVLEVGGLERRLAVWGTRVWQRRLGGGLVPSEPLPFERVEMGWQHAYGGRVVRPAQLVKLGGEDAILPPQTEAYPLNVDGVGFYGDDEAAAAHQPLPRIEDAGSLVRALRDRPQPMCLAPYPLWGGLRAAALLDPSDKAIDLSRAGRLFTRGSPQLAYESLEPGTRVALEGMRADGGGVSFEVPEPPASLDVEVGERSRSYELKLDTLDLYPEHGPEGVPEVRLVYRRAFRYPLVAFERRRAALRPRGPLVDERALGLT